MDGTGSPAERWFDEIDLDPARTWLRMGTRQLGSRPWLVFDEHRAAELALKRHLCAARHDEVFAAEAGSAEAGEQAGHEVLELVRAACRAEGLDPGRHPLDRADRHPLDRADRHPLDRAGRLVQEDLCLLRRDRSGWVLAAGSLCFPTRWRLGDKLGRSLTAVHAPVEGYQAELASRVETMLDRLDDRIVWRRNWFVHPDGRLFQPDRPIGGDPVVPARSCGDGLFLRSERQTLRRLPASTWILFTIRIQHAPLGRFLADADRRSRFRRYLDEAPPAITAHRGLAAGQVLSLRWAVDHWDRMA